ncbi:MAG TPA: GNAT family N-acetyltransferase [Xanthomonadaceae bacterium]|nr:GNAT family N-acetyltransferase [Xanthomonadaceae bacterium]
MDPSRGQAWSIRPIDASDDPAVAAIIRTVMPEFGASGPGFAIHDPEVDSMHATYSAARSAYFVIELDGELAGGGGIAPLEGADPEVCELRKMYFLPRLRGLGAGRALMQRCIETARGFGFRRCYLETLAHMDAAQRLYERSGFVRIHAPMGNTGHFGCNSFYLLELGESDSSSQCR